MTDTEFNAVLELLALLVLDWRNGVLIVLLVTAALFDYRTHRIPNWLVLSGALFGLGYNMVFPPTIHAGLLWPLAGLAVGFFVFLPLYMLGTMGAGDVKLMAMVGAFIGPYDMVWTLIYTLIAGGILSIVYVLATGTAGRLFRNVRDIFLLNFLNLMSHTAPDLRMDEHGSAGKMPYGIAIACGTLGYLILHPFGFL
jgi:prepilin peptidase CpaA